MPIIVIPDSVWDIVLDGTVEITGVRRGRGRPKLPDNHRRGRPKVDDENKQYWVAFYLPSEFVAWIDKNALEFNVTRSEFIRIMLDGTADDFGWRVISRRTAPNQWTKFAPFPVRLCAAASLRHRLQKRLNEVNTDRAKCGERIVAKGRLVAEIMLGREPLL